MDTIVTEIAENFIKKIVGLLTEGEKGLAAIEESMLTEAKHCAAKLTGAYAEAVDAAIMADKGTRREKGYSVQRKCDERRIATLVGEVSYKRTYYKKASGGYEYLTDTALWIEKRERVSSGLSLALVRAAKEMSYAKSSKYASDGGISRQTVMGRVRRSSTAAYEPDSKRKVPELHIDADEAHVTLVGGKKSEVPLISVYEGIESRSKRHECKNVFHISEYGKKPDELWEQVLTEIERRYDLTDTKIYLHGDGANWIQTGFDWIPNAVFVLDKYHKNKAIKQMTAGLLKSDRKLYDREIRWALENEELRFFDELTAGLYSEMPDREEKILSASGYLKRLVKGISVASLDPGANNGGCTEPHVSHVLSSRLSSRPMAWSKKTLKRLAPVLASDKAILCKKDKAASLPKLLRKAAASASKAFRRNAAGLPYPDSIGRLPISGHVTGTHKILKLFA